MLGCKTLSPEKSVGLKLKLLKPKAKLKRTKECAYEACATPTRARLPRSPVPRLRARCAWADASAWTEMATKAKFILKPGQPGVWVPGTVEESEATALPCSDDDTEARRSPRIRGANPAWFLPVGWTSTRCEGGEHQRDSTGAGRSRRHGRVQVMENKVQGL